MIAVAVLSAAPLLAAEPSPERDEDRAIRPLLVKYCHGCHNAQQREGEIDLASFANGDELAADARRLESLLEAVGEGFMPPQDARRQPSPEERALLLEWLRARLQRIALAQAGDPGQVVVRRLTHSELNYTLADLTGIERDWTKDFPQDGSGGEGFSNTGQTLQMSASQIEKYLTLAQRLADHALLLPGSGPLFLETPASTLPAAEQGRLTLARLDQFCRANALIYRDVTPREQIASYAYPDAKSSRAEGFQQMRGYKPFSSEVPGATLNFLGSTHRLFYRTERLNPTPATFMIHQGTVSKPAGKGEPPRSLTAAELATWNNLWLDLRHATRYARPAKISLLHRWFSHQAYRLGDNAQLEAEMKKWKIGDGKSPDGYRRHSLDPSTDLSFTVLALADYIAEIRTFSAEELRDFANIQHSRDGESRTLMAPNHDAFDAFLHLSLTDEQLEELWRIACDPNGPLAQRLGGVPSQAMQSDWKSWTERRRQWEAQALPAARQALCRFASRAWRRPLSAEEDAAICRQFDQEMAQGQTLQEAMRLPLVRIFLSPFFLYRMEFGERPAVKGQSEIRPLDDFELASRLSYFLWSSLPDRQLREAAERGELSDPRQLASQAQRMLKDAKIRRFSRELFGQWLGFYRFREFDRPDSARFPEFDAELRDQMYNEAIDFCTDLAANDRDIRLLLSADYAFLPRRLAQHYGVPLAPNEDAWSKFQPPNPRLLPAPSAPRISLASTPRRGVLGWGAVLTATSHPLRTSPVLRGDWILDGLLGIPTPPPPKAVPELPEDEKNDGALTVAQLLARHRQDKACAVCHDRIDPLGLALENYDPIGRYRLHDINRAPINADATLHDGAAIRGAAIRGAAGLVDFLRQKKQLGLFTRRLSRKTLGYALGREVLPGDTPLLEEINARLAADNYRFSLVIESIVASPQFRHLRREVEPGPTAKSAKP